LFSWFSFFPDCWEGAFSLLIGLGLITVITPIGVGGLGLITLIAPIIFGRLKRIMGDTFQKITFRIV
jgi:hypothetical protein